MKIVITTSAFPTDVADHLPLFILEQVEALKSLDEMLDIHVLTPHNALGSKQPNTRKLTTHTEHRYHYFWPYRTQTLTGKGILPSIRKNIFCALLIPFYVIFQHKALFKLCKLIQPDLIYAHWFTPQAIIAASVSRKTGTCMMFTTHASDVSILKKFPFSEKLVKSVLNQASSITAVSSRTASKLRNMVNERDWQLHYAHKLNVIPMGTHKPTIISDWLDPDTTQPSDQRKLILAIGRLASKKGFNYLIEAYAAAGQELQENYKLIIAGSGPLENALSLQISKLNMRDNITLAGHVHTRYKDSLLREASLFVLPSIIDRAGDSEGLPVSLLEALSYGKLVVATNVSGAEELLDSHTGILVEPNSAIAIRDGIMSYISMNNKERDQISIQAKHLSEEYSWPSVARRHLEVIQQIAPKTEQISL